LAGTKRVNSTLCILQSRAANNEVNTLLETSKVILHIYDYAVFRLLWMLGTEMLCISFHATNKKILVFSLLKNVQHEAFQAIKSILGKLVWPVATFELRGLIWCLHPTTCKCWWSVLNKLVSVVCTTKVSKISELLLHYHAVEDCFSLPNKQITEGTWNFYSMGTQPPAAAFNANSCRWARVIQNIGYGGHTPEKLYLLYEDTL